MFNFQTDLIDRLYEMGIYDVVLPFLLVFTLVFAFLQKTKILGVIKNTTPPKPQVKFNVVIATIMGILATTQPWVVQMFHNALPKVSVTIIGILMFFILIAMFSGGPVGLPKGGWLKTLILVGPAIAVGYYFLSEIYDYFPYVDFLADNIMTIIVIAVFAIIILFITTEEKTVKYNNEAVSRKKFNNLMWNDFVSPHHTNYPYNNYVIEKTK